MIMNKLEKISSSFTTVCLLYAFKIVVLKITLLIDSFRKKPK